MSATTKFAHRESLRMSFKRFPANTSQRGENEVEIKLSSPATEQTVVRDNKEKGENIGCEDTYREYKSAVPPSNENEGQHDAEVRIISIPFSPPTPRKYLEEKKPSDRVGKYTIMRTIGHGNFAQVKLAVHENTFSEVAIKINDKKTLSEPCLIKLTREIRVLKTLTHPNIVRLYEVIETERHVYIVTEYARNGEIFEYLNKNGRMKEQEARPIFRQLLSAVEYCHQKHIVHRDLKTENLLLDDNNNLKLADFGFANTFDDSCTLNTFCGSPPYAAPELLNGQTYHGPEVDVWSMGVILYMLVCNELPFDGYTLKELRARVMRGRYKIPFYLSHSLEALLKKMLIIKPEKRATIPALMSDTWVNLGFENDPLRPYVEPPLHYDDVVRTALMSQMGFKREEIEDAFENKRFNDVTATYLLLGSAEARQKVRRHLQAQEINNNKSRNILERANSVIMVGGRNRPNSPGRQDTGEDAGKFRPRNLGEWVTTSLRISDPRGKPSASIEQNKEVCGPQTNLHQIGNGPRKPNEILIIERDSPKPDLQTRDRTSAARNRLPSDNSPLVQDPSVPRPRTRSTRRTPSNGKYGTGKPPCFDSDNKRSQSPGYQDESKRELMFQPSIGKGMQMKRTNHQLPDVVQPARRMTRGNVIIVSDITQNKAEQDNTSPKHMTDQRGETRRRPERRKVSALKVTIPDAGDNRSDSETIDSPTELDVSKRWPRTIYASSRAARREEPEDEALNRFFFSPPIQRKEYNIYPRHPGLDTLHTSPEEKQSREEREKHWKKYEGTTFVVDDDSLGNPRLNSATRANEHIIRLDDRHKIHPTVEISRSPDSPEQVNPPVTVSKPLKGRTTFEPDLTKVPEMPNNVENKPQDRTASPRVQSPTSGLLPRVYTIVVPKRLV
ncbi:unnamed protein product [Calicophoron daubneyi]|uniref:non-specific serine/threonine protein kinase n=1 Tax=Calicophoron daubneyi TaxID=300641 RepID=A0AAV2TEC5_CALDB